MEDDVFAGWTPRQIADARRWVRTWRKAGPLLEKIRREELRRLDQQRAIALLCGEADYTVPPRAPRPTLRPRQAAALDGTVRTPMSGSVSPSREARVRSDRRIDVSRLRQLRQGDPNVYTACAPHRPAVLVGVRRTWTVFGRFLVGGRTGMARTLDLEALLKGCADDSFDDGIRISTELDPVSGRGGPVKPAVYEGGKYQQDRRWANPDDAAPTPVIVIDNVPSQANRLEDALRRHRKSTRVPEIVLDLSGVENLPAHLPRSLSSWEFPHRNADAYLRDARRGDEDFIKTDVGKEIFGATAQTCGPLMAWFPGALLYGFWQSHLGKKRTNAKHARAWVSEIVGWNPAATETQVLGLKGDPLNLSTEDKATFDTNDLLEWQLVTGEKKEKGRSAKGQKLSEIGHGQALLKTGNDGTPAAVSFARVTQRATVSFAQLRRVSLGPKHTGDADTAARALLVALGLHAHVLAFGRGFALRSGAELRPRETTATWLGSAGDEPLELGDAKTTKDLLCSARKHARSAKVPLEGWSDDKNQTAPMKLTPKDNLRNAIRATWPDPDLPD